MMQGKKENALCICKQAKEEQLAMKIKQC